MFKKELILIGKDEKSIPNIVKTSEEFETLEAMESFPVSKLLDKYPEGHIQDRTVNEYENGKLFKSYEYADPTGLRVESINIEEDRVGLNEGSDLNIEIYHWLKSMNMVKIRDIDAPLSILWRTRGLCLPDGFYRDAEYNGVFDTVAFDTQYDAFYPSDKYFGVWFGLNRVKESEQSVNLVWKFNSIFMLSTISGKKKTFGSNSFQDSDFEKLVPLLGFEDDKDLWPILERKNDTSVAERMGLKPCDESTTIFTLCKDARRGIFI
jgi:hypothetical protein